jgi:aryl-alcohol dehydrogenase-like predicted oxidoreductase
VPVSTGIVERRRFANTDLTVSIIGLGCYVMSGAYGPADDAESIATIHRAMAKATIIA